MEIGFLMLVTAAVVSVYMADITVGEVRIYRRTAKGKYPMGDAVSFLAWLAICASVVFLLAYGGLRLMGK